MTEWSSTDYQLWNSVTIKKEWGLEILLNNKMGKIGIKILKKRKNTTAGKYFTGKLHMWDYLT